VFTAAAPKREVFSNALNIITKRPFLLLAFSLFYFSDVYLRASEKFLWYDEIFTLYFSRLPSLRSLWSALTSGVGFNPPLFYLLTRASQSVFGEGNVSIRLPEIAGFWIFSICLFHFVAKRAGTLAGAASMLFPMLTGAYFYAYDARPHGIVLAACGLALVCWQRAMETSPPARKWLVGFAGSLLLAFMLHCYALILVAPFALIEVFQALRYRRINWLTWLAMLMPVLVSLPMYLFLLGSYRKLNTANTFSAIAVARWKQVSDFYVFLFAPCILVVVGIMLLFAADTFVSRRLNSTSNDISSSPLALHDLLLAFAFTAIPFFGVLLGKVINGACFSRYFLAGLAGVTIAVGMGSGFRRRYNWLSAALLMLMIAAAGISFVRLAGERLKGQGEQLQEPSMRFALDTTPGQPLRMHQLLTAGRTELPIVVLNALDFIYLVQYDPQIRPQLYFLTKSESHFIYHGFRDFIRCCGINFNAPLTYEQFLRAHRQYFVYGTTENLENVAVLSQLGARIEWLRVFEGHFLGSARQAK
jgi:hypothetical protein